MNKYNKIFFVLAVMSVSFLLVVWVRVKFIRTGYQVSSLKDKSRQLELDVSALELEMAQLKSPARVAALAQQKGYTVAGGNTAGRIRYLKGTP